MTSSRYELRKTCAGEPVSKDMEVWSLSGPHGVYVWEVDATYHKPFDILRMKATGHRAFRRALQQIAGERVALFAENDHSIAACPVCSTPSSAAAAVFAVYGGSYVACPTCTHRYVVNRLSKERLEAYYRSSNLYQSTYAQKEKAMVRVEEVHRPKLDWLLKQFERRHGRPPRRVLDVGAGSGHFSVACREQGIPCDGIELSEEGRTFAREVFDVELIDADFTVNADRFAGRYDLVTCWGLIEHVPDPGAVLDAAARVLRGADSAMMVASVPRWQSVSSTVQMNRPEAVIRHLDPLGHIQCFTDTSVAALVARRAMAIDAVWYFGMDAYELLIQLADVASSDDILMPAWIASLQRAIDLAALADSMIFTAVP